MKSLARATAVMSIGTVLSRATGLLRLAAITATLGIVTETGGLADTYNFANTAPNIIYELVLGGILTSVFVPVFVELLEKEGRERAWQVASAIINVSLVALTAIAILGMLAAPLIADIYTYRLDDAQAAVAQPAMSFLLRLFIPQIIFYGLAAMTAGLLNAHKRFGAPMYTPVLNNLAVIAIFIAFHQAYGKVTLEEITAGQLLLIGLGTTAGVALMALAQLPFLRGLGRYRLTVALRHPSVRKLAKLSVFVLGYVVVNQIGYFVAQILASSEVGNYSAYITAFTFFMLPHGLFAVSVITALLPGMSEDAVHERWDGFRSRLSVGVRATFLLILPAAVGYFVLGEPIVRLLERGVVSERSTELVASVLRFFVLGLVPFSLFQLFLRAFYAMHNTKTPFLINCAAVALNTAINIPMYVWFGVRGLAAGHAVAYAFGVTLQGRYLSRKVGGIDGHRILRSFLRIGVAAAGMGLLVWLASRGAESIFPTEEFGGQVAAVVAPVVVGVVTYLGLAAALKVEELNLVRGIASRRLGRKSS